VPDSSSKSRGTVGLLTVMLLTVLAAALIYATVVIVTAEHTGVTTSVKDTQALFVAEAGLHRTLKHCWDIVQRSPIVNPFVGIDAMADTVLFSDVQLSHSGGIPVGTYTVTVHNVDAVGQYVRDVHLTIDACVPAVAQMFNENNSDWRKAIKRTANAVIRVNFARSEVFDYVYFINNWGWYYGDTIIARGNVRGNGQFDGGNYRATVYGIPRFANMETTDFSGRIDDGGIYSGWNIVNANRMRGNVSDPANRHPFDHVIPMPNLTDLTMYETIAQGANSYIEVGGETVAGAVVGDDPGEPSNLYLHGTPEAPITLHGPVVVRGDVVISGNVQGQGAIYAQRNVYIPGDLQYVTPPASLSDNPTEAEIESLLVTNANADALGLFAREHIIVGDYTNSSWRSYVNSWINDWRNESEEDTGEDQLPNTHDGRDGVPGTADDDVLEGDDQWTTEYYAQQDAEDGLIEPELVDTPVPGSGEDTDGDAQYDPRTSLSDFDLASLSLTSDDWAGNLPDGGVYFTDIASNRITNLDAVMYTNHTIGMLTTARGDLVINGAIVSRNEAIVYGTDHLILNYDVRLLMGGGTHGLYLPRAWRRPQIRMWVSN